MSLEQQLDRLTEALEANTAALQGKAGAAAPASGARKAGRPPGSTNKRKAEEEEETNGDEETEEDDGLDSDDEDDSEKGPTSEDVRKALVRVKTEVDKTAVVKILKSVGAKTFDEVEEDNLAKVLKLAKQALSSNK